MITPSSGDNDTYQPYNKDLHRYVGLIHIKSPRHVTSLNGSTLSLSSALSLSSGSNSLHKIQLSLGKPVLYTLILALAGGGHNTQKYSVHVAKLP